MRYLFILVAILSMFSCVSTKSTLKTVDPTAVKPSIKNNQYLITEYATDSNYGLKEDYPINIGLMTESLEEKHIAYFFNALEGENKESFTYEKTATCCPFPTKNNAMGVGTISVYEVTFEKSKKKKLVYFNSQERGKMMCPKGFSIKEVKQ